MLPFHPARNEQAMVHIAAGYARQRNRLGTFACTTSVGPGATNMVTGAALATINRLPVLLLPGDTFATRTPHPVLQQLEVPWDSTVSVNDCLRPVSRYYERLERPEQLVPAALEAMRVLTDPAETGAVTLAMPEDVQAEAFEVPEAFLEPRVWTVYRQPPAPEALGRAAELIARRAEAADRCRRGRDLQRGGDGRSGTLVDATGIPVCETQAGRGALVSEHPLSLGAVGATGTSAANRLAREADLVIGIGTRWSDFTTASKSAFQDPGVRFVNVNVAAFDAGKQSGLPLLGDARVALEQLPRRARRVAGRHRLGAARGVRGGGVGRGGCAARDCRRRRRARYAQAEIIGAINDAAGETGVVVCAAGSAPGDLHKLWVARDPDAKGYHVEYGYSCMGYEIPGGIGVKLAAPEREVYVLVGDGSYLMMPGELVTAVAERVPIVIVLVDNHGYASIGALSRSVGSSGFGTLYRFSDNGSVPVDPASTEVLPLDLAANAESLGAKVVRVTSIDELRGATRRRARRRRAGRAPHRGRPLPGRAGLRELVGRAGGGGVRRGRRAGRRGRDTSATTSASASIYAHAHD